MEDEDEDDDGHADHPDFTADVSDAELPFWTEHPLVVKVAPVTYEDEGEEVSEVGFWLRDPTDEEAAIERELSVKPDRPPELHNSGSGQIEGLFWLLFPRIEALVLHEDHMEGWWEAKIWLRRN